MAKKDVIDLSKQHWIDADGLKEDLRELRRFVFRLASCVSGEHEDEFSLSDFADKMFILNWLIDDVEFKD